MNKTKIEWTDYTKNPIKGICKMGCDYCYAIAMYKRFKWNPEIRFVPEVLDEIERIKQPSKIFLCSTHEFFGRWIPNEWRRSVLNKIKEYPQHIFQILTKHIERACIWNFPDNVWLGVTIDKMVGTRLICLRQSSAKIKFVSFEPLLGEIIIDLEGIDWIIIGAETGNRKGKVKPKEQWILNLLKEAEDHQIPIFMKNNLKPYYKGELIQEFPKI